MKAHSTHTQAGPRLNRAGGFTLDATGQVVTSDGLPVLGDGGAPLTIPTDATAIHVARDGTISTDQGEVGQIRPVRFENEQALKKQAGGLYDPAGEAPLPVDLPVIEQGKIEGSNVSGIVEMTKMIAAVRRYQAAAKMSDEEHQRQRRAIDALGSARR